VTNEPLEISVLARRCNDNGYHHVGDLVMYRSSLWMVKGLYFGATRTGDRELCYILSEVTRSPDGDGSVDDGADGSVEIGVRGDG